MGIITIASNYFNEIESAEAMWRSVEPIANHWLVGDTGSMDGTQELCRSLGAIVVDDDIIKREGYGPARTQLIELAPEDTDWVLIIDGDERIIEEDYDKFLGLSESSYDVICLPRQHYRAWDMSICENPDITFHADWQWRFVRRIMERQSDGSRKSKIKFQKAVHEHITGFQRPLQSFDNPRIRHFGWLKSRERLKEIADLCQVLYEKDLKKMKII